MTRLDALKSADLRFPPFVQVEGMRSVRPSHARGSGVFKSSHLHRRRLLPAPICLTKMSTTACQRSAQEEARRLHRALPRCLPLTVRTGVMGCFCLAGPWTICQGCQIWALDLADR